MFQKKKGNLNLTKDILSKNNNNIYLNILFKSIGLYIVVLFIVYLGTLARINGITDVNGNNRIDISRNIYNAFNTGKVYISSKYIEGEFKVLADIDNKNYHYEINKFVKVKHPFVPDFIFSYLNIVLLEYNSFNGVFVNNKTGLRIKSEELLISQLNLIKLYGWDKLNTFKYL